MSEIVNIITATTALVAVIVGPIVSIYVVRRQIHASVVSTNRQARFNLLRDAIAEWLTAEQVIFISKHTGFWEKPDAQQAFQKMVLQEYRIRLLVDPKEPDHAKLVELLRNEFNELNESLDSPPAEYDKRRIYGDDKIILLAQSILNKEWERVD